MAADGFRKVMVGQVGRKRRKQPRSVLSQLLD
jgi:hypothetical protein